MLRDSRVERNQRKHSKNVLEASHFNTSLVLLVSRMLSEPRKTREAPPCHPRRHGYQSIGPASHSETPDGGYATIPENGGIQRFISAVNVHRHGQRHGIRPKLFTAGPHRQPKGDFGAKRPEKTRGKNTSTRSTHRV